MLESHPVGRKLVNFVCTHTPPHLTSRFWGHPCINVYIFIYINRDVPRASRSGGVGGGGGANEIDQLTTNWLRL